MVVLEAEPDPNALDNLVAHVQRVWTEQDLCAALNQTSLPIIIQNNELGQRLELLHHMGSIAYIGRVVVRLLQSRLLPSVTPMRLIEGNWEFKHAHGKVMLCPRSASTL